jgi:hypothetical protein
MIRKIVSGGQTGADRAGLDVARRWDFPYGGWCPKGRRAEDGPISTQYQLVETPSSNYLQRTEWNARDSDATVVFTLAKAVSGGSARTIRFAREMKKPVIHISFSKSYDPAIELLRFVQKNKVRVLNVAGSRESKEPGLWLKTVECLEAAFFWDKAHLCMLGGPGEG